jgi:hypothetical protein
VSADVEYRVEILRLHVCELDRLGKRFLRGRVLLETRHCIGLIFRQIAFRIDRRLTAFG